MIAVAHPIIAEDIAAVPESLRDLGSTEHVDKSEFVDWDELTCTVRADLSN